MTLGGSCSDNVPALLAALASAPEHEWLQQGASLTLRSNVPDALAVFEAAATRFPSSPDIMLGLAGLLWQTGQTDRAQRSLRDWLATHPSDAGATFLLAALLREQGCMQAVGALMLSLFEHGQHDVDTVIRAVEMLDDYGRQADAWLICESTIARGIDDPRLHAYAGMLGIQLGYFDRTRLHYGRAMTLTPEAVNWNIPLGLAGLQRYSEADHPDFALFQKVLEQPGISDRTRQGTLFALGKAHDDLGDYGTAASFFRRANALAHMNSHWSRKHWKRTVDARIAQVASPIALPPGQGWTPVFIVGVPRSGTTLVARHLARHSGVLNRGELGWLSFCEQKLASRLDSRQELEAAAALYARHLRQDDDEACWYIDKQPLNLLRVDLAMALWPNARIIYCERGARDTALSLWSQSFHDPAHDYAYDFANIASVIRGCRRLAAHWRRRFPSSFYTVSYEELVGAPDELLGALAKWLGLPPLQESALKVQQDAISTASAWQARQNVYHSSVGRWRHYAPFVPELTAIKED